LEYSTVTVLLLSSPMSWFWFVSWKKMPHINCTVITFGVWSQGTRNFSWGWHERKRWTHK
jgi:hypothetical protein